MEPIYVNKKLIAITLVIILLSIQDYAASIFIDIGLIFSSMFGMRTYKCENNKFSYYIWLMMFVSSIILFFIKAFL